VQFDELGVLESRIVGTGASDDRNALDGAGEDGCSEAEPLVQAAAHLMKLVFDGAPFISADGLLGHEHFDVVAVATVRGDTSGGGVGVGDVTVLFEAGEFIADGGGGDVEAVTADQRARTHRDGRLDVFTDHESQDR